MSYGGFEYNERGFSNGFDGMGGFAGGYGGMDMGGGFMNEGKEKSSEKKSRDRQSLMPLSVHQLLSATNHDDVYRVDEVELNIVKIVGILSNAQEHTTNFTFMINDGSGAIECKLWIEKDASGMSKIAGLRNGVLARVIGNIREYDNKIHLSVYDAQPVQDWNELTYHILDVTHTHLLNTKGPLQSGAFIPNQSSLMQTSTPQANRGMVGGFASQNLNNAMKKEANNVNESIFAAYQSGPRDGAGLKYDEVMNILKRKGVNINFDQLVRGVQQLCNDGRLYTTIDDEHFLPTSDEY
eukprot:gene7584-8187_t